MKTKPQWYETFFDGLYGRVLGGEALEARAAADAKTIRRLLKLRKILTYVPPVWCRWRFWPLHGLRPGNGGLSLCGQWMDRKAGASGKRTPPAIHWHPVERSGCSSAEPYPLDGQNPLFQAIGFVQAFVLSNS